MQQARKCRVRKCYPCYTRKEKVRKISLRSAYDQHLQQLALTDCSTTASIGVITVRAVNGPKNVSIALPRPSSPVRRLP